MEGFSKLPKMKSEIDCYKEGGHVGAKNVMKRGKGAHEGESKDIAQDKAMIKKAFKQHDEAEHDKKPTEIKLRKGGRAKKEKGSVRKMKDGGGVYGAKKTDADLDSIKKVKETKPKKAAAESEAKKRPNLKGSDVEKEKSKPAGEKDRIEKVKPTGDKKADAPSKAKAKPARKGPDAIDDIDGYAPGGNVLMNPDNSPMPQAAQNPMMQSALAAKRRRQLMMAAQNAAGAGQAPQAPQAPQAIREEPVAAVVVVAATDAVVCVLLLVYRALLVMQVLVQV